MFQCTSYGTDVNNAQGGVFSGSFPVFGGDRISDDQTGDLYAADSGDGVVYHVECKDIDDD